MDSWEDVRLQTGGALFESLDLEAVVLLIILDRERFLNKKWSDVTEGSEVVTEADSSTLLLEAVEGVLAGGGLLHELLCELDGVLVHVGAGLGAVVLVCGQTELFGDSVCGGHLATKFLGWLNAHLLGLQEA